jgi:GrpB-like predicted nucleotidyltransferase (UPF0157 family)
MEKKIISVAPYNPIWSQQYTDEANLIKDAIGNNLTEIHHIGSTAVPGLASKPKIDIIAVMSSPKLSISELESIGYVYKGEWNIPGKYGFTKRGMLDINLHVYKPNHPEIEVNLLFRDYLRQNSGARNEYAALKYKLVKDERSHIRKEGEFFYGYTVGKGGFIRSTLKKRGFNKPRILKATDKEEWVILKKLRTAYFKDKGFKTDPYQHTFTDKNHAHLVLYQGVDIVGCAHVEFGCNNIGDLKEVIFVDSCTNRLIQHGILDLIQHWLVSRF